MRKFSGNCVLWKASALLIIAIAALMTGCANTSLRQDFTFDEHSTTGVVIVSMTYRGQTGFHISYRKTDDPAVNGRLFVEDAIGLPLKFEKSDFADSRGKLIAIELPPGDYELFSWGVNSGFLRLSATESFFMTVRVIESSITYAGNFHLKPTSRIGAMVTAAEMDLEDRFERDSPVFQEKYSRLNEYTLYRGIPESTLVENIGNGTQSSLNFVSLIVPAVIMAPLLD